MMYPIFTCSSRMHSETNCEEGCLLDLRIPEKQKIRICQNHEKSLIPDNFPCTISFKSTENFKNSPTVVSPQSPLYSCDSPNSTVSSSDSIQSEEITSRSTSKYNRPFKTLIKDPFLGIKTAVELLHEDVDYATFRKKMLSQTHINYNITNMNMRRKSVSNDHNSDPTYWEKRRKNNEAAKKSRDARKAREDEIAIRCAFLEQENLKLKLKISAIQRDTEKMHNLIYRR